MAEFRTKQVLKKDFVRCNLEGPISSSYLAHCPHPFFMSIHIEFLVSYSMLPQSCVVYKP